MWKDKDRKIIKSRCVDCNHPLVNKRSMRCLPCSAKEKGRLMRGNMSGENNPNYRGGLPLCLDCQKTLSQRNYTRCKTCSRKFQKGKNNPNYRGGPTKLYGSCLDCDTPLKNYVNTRCLPCHLNWKVGANVYNYTGNSTKNEIDRSHFTRNISPQILELYDYTCQGCSIAGGYLNAHHLNYWSDYPELRFDLDNCIPLCVECHYEEHFDHPLPKGSKWGRK